MKFNRQERTIALYSGKAPGATAGGGAGSAAAGVTKADTTANGAAASKPVPLGSWTAHNDTASTSRGPWTAGRFSWAYYKAHADAGTAPACHAESYGCYGIHVFDVPGRSGMGVHSGRTKGQPEAIGGKTLGCIRVTNGAMETINAVHASDRLQAIVVE